MGKIGKVGDHHWQGGTREMGKLGRWEYMQWPRQREGPRRRRWDQEVAGKDRVHTTTTHNKGVRITHIHNI
jgi:hypothetical protein